MSVDLLHEKVRKLKCPVMVDLTIRPDDLPVHLLEEEGSKTSAYYRFCNEILEGLRGNVPAVRFSFDFFALMGVEGSTQLSQLLSKARQLGYYVVMDAPQVNTPWSAEAAADTLFGTEQYPCDALIISPYIGTDALKPFLPYCGKEKKALFVIVRSANKSALELQDLMTGSRLVHGATAELVNRHGESLLAKCGYSCIGGVVSAGVPQSVRTLRTKHDRMYLLIDGLDYPSGNAKNCSYGFDRFGYGAVVSAGPSICAAWKESESDGSDYIEQAREATERIRKNIGRYITIL